MRIAFTHPKAGDLGGVERQAHGLAVALCDAGHEVHYFCQRATAVDPRIRVHRLPRPLRFVRSVRVWAFDALCRRALAREGPFDVVQGYGKTSRQDVYYDGSGCLADFQRYSIDTLAWGWRRELRRRGPHQRVVAAIERSRFTPGNYRRIVAMSGMVRDQILRRYGLPPEDVEVIRPGVDPARFHPDAAVEARPRVRRELGMPADAPVVCFLGSDYRRKGLATALRALRELPGAHVVVLGRDRHEQRYRRLAAELDVAERTHFLGLRPDPEPWLAASDALLFPTWFDAFGVVVLEAFACGVPVVVSARAGAAELVTSGTIGAVLDDPGDAAALAAAVRPFLEPERRARAAVPARRVAEDHAWERHRAQWLALYAQLAPGSVRR